MSVSEFVETVNSKDDQLVIFLNVFISELVVSLNPGVSTKQIFEEWAFAVVWEGMPDDAYHEYISGVCSASP